MIAVCTFSYCLLVFMQPPIFTMTSKRTKMKINVSSSNFNVLCSLNCSQPPVDGRIESMSWINKHCSSASEPGDEISSSRQRERISGLTPLAMCAIENK